MAKDVERTLISDYFYPKFSDQEKPARCFAGTRLTFSPRELDAAVKAGVVHADEAMDAEVKVGGGPTSVDPQPGSGPAPDRQEPGAARKKASGRYSGAGEQKPRRVRGRAK